jgi:hypothetical protein
MNGSFVNAMFDEEPGGKFSDGYVFRTTPDLASLQRDPANGYWHCDIAEDDKLTWSHKVYELFGLPPGTAVERDWAVECYGEVSKKSLERVRHFALNRKFGFILDAEIEPDGGPSRWIRVLAFPIVADGRPVGLHGVKRAL